MAKKLPSVNRREFTKRFVGAGFTYIEAGQAYDAMMAVIEDAVVAGQTINFGRVLSLTPTKLDPRPVHMNFNAADGAKRSRVYYLGQRIKYKVRLFASFMKTRAPRWV